MLFTSQTILGKAKRLI